MFSEDLSLSAAIVIAIATSFAQYHGQFQRISYALKIMLTLLCVETLAQTLIGITMCAMMEKYHQKYFEAPGHRHVAERPEERPPLCVVSESVDEKPAQRVGSDVFWKHVEQSGIDSDDEREKQAMEALEEVSAAGVSHAPTITVKNS